MASLANNVYELNAGIMNIVVATMSNICSALTLYIIWKCRRWNAYVQIIVSMTVSQLLYDISFYFLLNGSNWSFYVQEFLSTFAGSSTTLWTNIMSGVVMYLVVTRKSMDIESMYLQFFSFVFTISIVLAVIGCVYLNSPRRDYAYGSYIVFRALSILFNVVSYFVIYRNLDEIGSSSRYSSTKAPLQTLSSRIKYYPIIQVLSRAWPTYYEYKYGFSKLHDKVYATNSTWQIASLYLFAIFLPIAGIGFFFVFLAMQPMAMNSLRTMVGYSKRTRSHRSGFTYTTLGQSDLSGHQFALLEEEIANVESVGHTYTTSGRDISGDETTSRTADHFETQSVMSNNHLVSTGTRQQLMSYDEMDERELFQQLKEVDMISTAGSTSTNSYRFLFFENSGAGNTNLNQSQSEGSARSALVGSRGKSSGSGRT